MSQTYVEKIDSRGEHYVEPGTWVTVKTGHIGNSCLSLFSGFVRSKDSPDALVEYTQR